MIKQVPTHRSDFATESVSHFKKQQHLFSKLMGDSAPHLISVLLIIQTTTQGVKNV